MAETKTIPDYPRGLTFEQVWAGIQELKESQRETARQIEETGRQIKETGRQMKETDRKMGDLYNRFGELAEHLVAPSVAERFNELGYHFDAVMPGGLKIKNKDGSIRAQFDLWLENGDTLMAVEVKAKPNEKDVEYVLSKMEIIREHRRGINDSRKIHGAIAGAIFGEALRRTAAQAGLFVLVQSGDTMKMDIPKGFMPREW